MIAFCPMLYPPQNPHRGIWIYVIVKLHNIQIFHGYPPENNAR